MVSTIINATERMIDNKAAPSILAEPVIVDSDFPAILNEIPSAKNIEMI